MSKKEYASRHAPAFILLFLAKKSDYGGSLLAGMKREMPHFLGDSAMVYRTLRALESEGCIESRWDIQDVGQPKRFYAITDKGWERLEEYFRDIKMRQENLQFFIDSYQKIFENRSSSVE
jgi:DNA-binding PadR family transcriptional regulator